MKVAMITGATGQDASYLIELLLGKGYIVHGVIRRSSIINTERIDHMYDNPNLYRHYGDMTDGGSLTDLIYNIKPDEIYNLAAMSHVRLSYDMPEYTGDVVGLGVTRLLDALRRSGVKARYYQASSSELFGTMPPPQNEQTPFAPCSPYGVAKAYGYWMTVMYRKAYGMWACNGILFNHESPRRGETFVSRKIAKGLAKIKRGETDSLVLGNLWAYRDWGYAPNFVEAMWRLMQMDEPGDYVVGTGESHTVAEFLLRACDVAKVDPEVVISGDSRYTRPIEVDHLRADFSKMQKATGWTPTVTFSQLVKLMVESELSGHEVRP